MSYRDIAKNLIDTIPESKLYYVVAYLQGVSVPDETPNAETVAALLEGDEMLRTGSGQAWTGSTEELFKQILEEDDQ